MYSTAVRSAGQALALSAWHEAELRARLAARVGEAAARPVLETMEGICADARDCLPGASVHLALVDLDTGTPDGGTPDGDTPDDGTPRGGISGGGVANAGLVPPVGPGLLVVPVVVRGRTVATARVRRGPGVGSSAGDDARCASLVAAAAAVVIERAQTVRESSRRGRWSSGGASLARELVAGHPFPLRLLARRTAEIAEADVVCFLQPAPDGAALTVMASAGDPPTNLAEGSVWSGVDSVPARVMTLQRGVNVRRWADREPGEDQFGPNADRSDARLEAALVVPLVGVQGHGVLVIGRRRHRAAFTPGELGTATMFAAQIALALELAESRTHRDLLVLMQERDRISHDLHDEVIQRLFAVGMSLQRAGAELTGAPLQRIQDSIDGIDDTIAQLRATIHHLTRPGTGEHRRSAHPVTAARP